MHYADFFTPSKCLEDLGACYVNLCDKYPPPHNIFYCRKSTGTDRNKGKDILYSDAYILSTNPIQIGAIGGSIHVSQECQFHDWEMAHFVTEGLSERG